MPETEFKTNTLIRKAPLLKPAFPVNKSKLRVGG